MLSLISRSILAIFFVLVLVLPGQAHKPTIIIYARHGSIYTECYLDHGVPANKHKVEVRDAKSKELLRIGTTNAAGQWSFSISRLPQQILKNKIDLLFILTYGTGKKAQVSMPAAQYLAATR